MINAKKSLGQNFLIDETITSRIVASVSPLSTDIIFEIGPGQGALTKHLLKKSGFVVAVELDARLIERLNREYQSSNFKLIHADALTVDWVEAMQSATEDWQRLYPATEGIPRRRVVANLPYYVATPIVERLLKLRRQVSDLTLMLQEEVVDRITAAPGGKEYGYLTLLVAYYATANKLFVVPPTSFSPVPKVYSAVVRLTLRDQPAVAVGDEKQFFGLMRAAFAQRRKTILNNLKAAASALKYKQTPDAALADAGIDAKRRAETVTLEEFAGLYENLFEG